LSDTALLGLHSVESEDGSQIDAGKPSLDDKR